MVYSTTPSASQGTPVTPNSKLLNGRVHSLTHSLTYLLTPWNILLLEKPTVFLASQEISGIVWNPKVHYLIHKCRLPVPVLGQINPVHAPHIPLPEDPS